METQRQTDREEKGGWKTYVANERKTENTHLVKQHKTNQHVLMSGVRRHVARKMRALILVAASVAAATRLGPPVMSGAGTTRLGVTCFLPVSVTYWALRPRGRSPQQCTVIRVQASRPAVEASLGRGSSSSDTVPAGDRRLMERSPRHTLPTLTLTWRETGGEE
ncbi:hypothetical protein EYF80_045071 [Liparis tanakae]|uniref:Uncharacterized protein n=1 Tax=Liparis tanakae TaxID=230148 RepID=A0A4Z2FUN9_9TELE|nr:hypothetical protein EYF80_045071 [Liparis tanakae]